MQGHKKHDFSLESHLEVLAPYSQETKKSLFKTVNGQRFTQSELETALKLAQASLNSRPLIAISGHGIDIHCRLTAIKLQLNGHEWPLMAI